MYSPSFLQGPSCMSCRTFSDIQALLDPYYFGGIATGEHGLDVAC